MTAQLFIPAPIVPPISQLNMHRHLLTDPEQIRTFVLAGNSTFTLKSLKTQEHYTYHVEAKDPADPNFWFVQYLAGYNDHKYIGVLQSSLGGLAFRRTKSSRLENQATPMVAIMWFAHWVLNQGHAPDQLQVWHEGRCGRCNRMLTDPDSIARGIGPDCMEKMR